MEVSAPLDAADTVEVGLGRSELDGPLQNLATGALGMRDHQAVKRSQLRLRGVFGLDWRRLIESFADLQVKLFGAALHRFEAVISEGLRPLQQVPNILFGLVYLLRLPISHDLLLPRLDPDLVSICVYSHCLSAYRAEIHFLLKQHCSLFIRPR